MAKQTTAGDLIVNGEVIPVNSGTIVRVDGLISTITVGDRVRTITRNTSGFTTSVSDGTYTETITRDVNNNITSWSNT